MILKSNLLENLKHIEHGFSTLTEPFPLFLKEQWTNANIKWKQTHGVNIHEIKNKNTSCQDSDGFFTKETSLPLAIMTADCVPILIADKKRNFIFAIHAGWRGTYALIHHSLLKLMNQYSIAPNSLCAAIGPCIHPCCYEVGEDLIQKFNDKFKNIMCQKDVSPQNKKLDLVTINIKILNSIGIYNIDTIPTCTNCSLIDKKTPLFHSFRREATKDRQYSVISIK